MNKDTFYDNQDIPWNSYEYFPDKPEELAGEYGYYNKKNFQACSCSKESLLKHIRNAGELKFIYLPEIDKLILPEIVEWLHPYVRERNFRKAWSGFAFYLFITVVVLMALKSNASTGTGSLSSDNTNHFPGAITAFLYSVESTEFAKYWPIFTKVAIVLFVLLPLLYYACEILRYRVDREGLFQEDSYNTRFEFWLSSQKKLFLNITFWLLIAITFLQYRFGWHESISAIGLIKSVDSQVEYKYLLSTTLLHTGLIHASLSAISILLLGGGIQALTHFSYAFLVFVISAFIGNISSLHFLPEATLIGASGGVLGLLGFLIVAYLKKKSILPAQILIGSAGFIPLLYVIESQLGHIVMNFSGFLAGTIMGLLMLNDSDETPLFSVSRPIITLGYIAMVTLYLSIGMTAWLLVSS